MLRSVVLGILLTQIAPEGNDTVKVLQELSSKHTHSEVLETLGSIHGPWSFVFWQVHIQLYLILQ